MRSPKQIPVKTIALGAIVATVGIAGTAGAASLITSAQIKDGAVMNRDIHRGTISESRLDRGVVAKLNKAGTPGVSVSGKDGRNGERGEKGDRGPAGASGLVGAYQVVAHYDISNGHADRITVPCRNGDTAISGGWRADPHTTRGDVYNAVANSYAGRMDWATVEPIPGRMDGWIVQFDGRLTYNAGPPTVPYTIKGDVYAVCVPGHLDTVTFKRADDGTYSEVG